MIGIIANSSVMFTAKAHIGIWLHESNTISSFQMIVSYFLVQNCAFGATVKYFSLSRAGPLSQKKLHPFGTMRSNSEIIDRYLVYFDVSDACLCVGGGCLNFRCTGKVTPLAQFYCFSVWCNIGPNGSKSTKNTFCLI